MAYRREPLVREYQACLRDVRDDLGKGRITQRTRKEVQRAAAAFTRRLAAPKEKIPVRPSASAETDMDLACFHDWLLFNRPGKRYQKLLLKLAAAQQSYVAIDLHLKRLWQAA